MGCCFANGLLTCRSFGSQNRGAVLWDAHSPKQSFEVMGSGVPYAQSHPMSQIKGRWSEAIGASSDLSVLK
jgi:hypothetical protein